MLIQNKVKIIKIYNKYAKKCKSKKKLYIIYLGRKPHIIFTFPESTFVVLKKSSYY